MANVNARRVEEILTSGITAGHYVAGSNITITENQDGTETIASTGGGGGGDYELISNKVTSISSASTDTQYPSAKCVYDIVGNIQTVLASLTTPSSP